ncbi:hypothetical protein PSPO01_08069 [Paraphaeosphaeria sporulosa]
MLYSAPRHLWWLSAVDAVEPNTTMDHLAPLLAGGKRVVLSVRETSMALRQPPYQWAQALMGRQASERTACEKVFDSGVVTAYINCPLRIVISCKK